jgi:putative methyltransferase (TIGR01177 family)
MARHVACLRGWHPALARAEIAALLPNMTVHRLEPRRLMALEGNATTDELDEAVRLSSGCQAILCNALTWNTDNASSFDEFIASVVDHLSQHPRKGSVAVRAWRHEGRIKGIGPSQLAQRIGGRFHDLGYPIELDNPEHRFGVVIDASSNTVVCGWMVGFGDESDGVSSRKAAERPFFKPVSLDPRLARLAVNLASGPIQNGATIDLMTGTGGFLIEAALSKRTTIGLDLDPIMVEGTRQNLAWAMAEESITEHQAQVCEGDATQLKASLPTLQESIAGFVLDPPYGRNSQGSLAPVKLLREVLTSASSVANSATGLVLILPIHPLGEQADEALRAVESVDLLHGQWNDTVNALNEANWVVQNRWVEHVHGSLSRLILHATIVPQG